MRYSIKIAETIMQRFPNADSYPYKSWTYPQGFMLWGMEALYRYTGDSKYYDYIISYAEAHVDNNGNLARFKGNSMDDMMTGSIIVWAYHKTGAEKFKKACDAIRRAYDDYPRNADGGFWHAKSLPYEMWVDGVFMGQMFLSKYGFYINDGEYSFNEAARQLKVIYNHCNKDGLILHAYSEDKRPSWADKQTGLSPEVWCEGLGWYALIMPQVLELMPETHPDRSALIKQYRQLLYSLKKYQSAENGLWFQIVDKGDMPDNWTDTSGSAMFAYSIQKAIELGIIDNCEFKQVVETAYKGLISKAVINENGLLDIYDACQGLCVQDNYDIYINYKRTVNAQEAVAAFLWAMAIIEKPGNEG